MRRLLFAFLLALLLAAMPGLATLGQSPEWTDRLEPSGGRVEVTEAGYALTFPEGWLVLRPMAADAAALVAGVREIEPELASIVEAGLANGMGLTLMAFGPAGEDGWSQGCNVLSTPMADQSMDEIILAEVAAFELAGDSIVSGPDLAQVQLPIGDAWRIDYVMSMRGIERATSVHLLHDGLQRHALTCGDQVHPEDRWLSLAETFEFLPGEGSGAMVRHPFPSADEISDALGVDVETLGVGDGLSQAWEGTTVDWETLPSAQLAVYASPTAEGQAPLAGAVIDVARFESVDDAVQHIDEVPFNGGWPAFGTQVAGDFVATASFTTDDGMSGSVVFLRRGPLVVAITAFAAGIPGMEAASEAILELVLDRIPGES